MPPDEHDDAVSPFGPSHIHEPWPYVCTSRRSRPCPYVRTWPYFSFLHTGRCTYVYMLRARLYYDTCAPLLRQVPFLARQRFIAAACRQTDRPVCTYMFATRMTTLRTLRPGRSRVSGTSLRAKMLLVGPSSQGGESFFFARMHFLACEGVAGGSQQSGGTFFSRNTVARPVGPCCQVEESLFSA